MMKTVKYISTAILFLYLMSVVVLCMIQTDTLPHVEVEWFGIPADKIVHFLMFFPFPILTWLAFFKDEENKLKKTAILATVVAGGIVLAAGTEVAQAFTEYREGDILDFAADCAGMAAGFAVVVTASLFFAKRHRK